MEDDAQIVKEGKQLSGLKRERERERKKCRERRRESEINVMRAGEKNWTKIKKKERERQTDRQIDGQTDRQTERNKERERERERERIRIKKRKKGNWDTVYVHSWLTLIHYNWTLTTNVFLYNNTNLI